MKLSLNVLDSKAEKLLSFLRTLDYVTIDNEPEYISPDLKKALNIALEDIADYKGVSHNEAYEHLKNKHPKYFK